MKEFAARYFDGRTAAGRDVTLRVGPDGVAILDDGTVVETWHSDEVRLVPGDVADPTVRLTRAGDEAARLVAADPDLRTELLRRVPILAVQQSPRTKAIRLSVWGAGLAVVATAVVAALHFLPAVATGLVPQSWEERVGRQTVDDIVDLLSLRQDLRCGSAPGRAALDQLTQRLSAGIDTPYRFHVTVLDIPLANAFAAPGGHVVVFRGLFDLADSPDAVAGVLAHEFAHVVSRHPTQSVLRSQGLAILPNLLTGNMAGGDVIGGLGSLVIGASYSRRAEAEADSLAAEILASAAISTAGLAAVFDRLAAEEANAVGEYAPLFELISSHPRSTTRAEAVARTKDAGSRPALSGRAWHALKGICQEP